jgi:GDPmannose 4,6-dehydratase
MLVTVNPIKGEYYNIGGTYTCKVGDTLNTLLSYSTIKDISVESDLERLRPIVRGFAGAGYSQVRGAYGLEA